MTTALRLIKDAMLELGILQTQEEPDAAEAQDALRLLNQLLKYWQIKGIPLSHADLALSDTLPYPDDHILPIVLNLAVYMARQYDISLEMDTIAKAEDAFDHLLSIYGKRDFDLNIYAESY